MITFIVQTLLIPLCFITFLQYMCYYMIITCVIDVLCQCVPYFNLMCYFLRFFFFFFLNGSLYLEDVSLAQTFIFFHRQLTWSA